MGHTHLVDTCRWTWTRMERPPHSWTQPCSQWLTAACSSALPQTWLCCAGTTQKSATQSTVVLPFMAQLTQSGTVLPRCADPCCTVHTAMNCLHQVRTNVALFCFSLYPLVVGPPLISTLCHSFCHGENFGTIAPSFDSMVTTLLSGQTCCVSSCDAFGAGMVDTLTRPSTAMRWRFGSSLLALRYSPAHRPRCHGARN